MQITYNDAHLFRKPMAFAIRRSRDYMMRSEKRMPEGGSGRPGSRKPPRRRRKAGFFYILMTILLSLIFWPIGMIMLWRRKVRWNGGVKLVFSVISLFLCIFLIVFALTVPTGNDKITGIQDTVNDYLDEATNAIAAGYDVAYEKGGEAIVEMTDFAEAFAAWSAGYVADGLDYAVDFAGEARDFVVEKYNELSSGEETDPTTDGDADEPTSEPASEPTDEPTAEPAQETTAEPSEEPAAEPAEETTSEPAAEPAEETTSEPTAEPADEPAAEPTEEAAAEPTAEATEEPTEAPAAEAADSISIQLPEGTPDPASAQPLEAGMLTGEGFEPGVIPENAPVETAVPETTPTVEPAATPAAENPIPVKEALAQMGMIEANYRMPLCPMADDTRAHLTDVLKEAGLVA